MSGINEVWFTSHLVFKQSAFCLYTDISICSQSEPVNSTGILSILQNWGMIKYFLPIYTYTNEKSQRFSNETFLSTIFACVLFIRWSLTPFPICPWSERETLLLSGVILRCETQTMIETASKIISSPRY